MSFRTNISGFFRPVITALGEQLPVSPPAVPASPKSEIHKRLESITKWNNDGADSNKWPESMKKRLKNPEAPKGEANPEILAPEAENEKEEYQKQKRHESVESCTKILANKASVENAYNTEILNNLLKSETSLGKKLIQKLDNLDIAPKKNKSKPSINFICAVLQQVTGIYETDDLPAAARLLIKNDNELHQVEAEYILKKISSPSSPNVTLGTNYDDVRLQKLAEYIEKKYATGKLDINILTPAADQKTLASCPLLPIPATDNANGLRIAILKTDEGFEALTRARTAANPLLDKEFYNKTKTTLGHVRVGLADLRNRERRTARSMSDSALSKKVGVIRKGWTPEKNNEFDKEWAKRTGLGGPRKLKGSMSLLDEAKEFFGNDPCRNLNDDQLAKCVARIKVQSDQNTRGGYTDKQIKIILTEARKRELYKLALQPEEKLDDLSLLDLAEVLRTKEKNKKKIDYEAILRNGKTAKLAKVPVVEPLADQITIDQIKTDFAAYFAQAKVSGASNQLIAIATSQIEKAQAFFYDAILNADKIALEKAKTAVVDAIEILEGPGAGERAAAEHLNSRINSLTSQNIWKNSPEMKAYHTRNLAMLGVMPEEAQDIFSFENYVESRIGKFDKLLAIKNTQNSPEENNLRASLTQAITRLKEEKKIMQKDLFKAENDYGDKKLKYDNLLKASNLILHQNNQRPNLNDLENLETAKREWDDKHHELLSNRIAHANCINSLKENELAFEAVQIALEDIQGRKLKYQNIRITIDALKQGARIEEYVISENLLEIFNTEENLTKIKECIKNYREEMTILQRDESDYLAQEAILVETLRGEVITERVAAEQARAAA